jgi:hypothetical protein
MADDQTPPSTDEGPQLGSQLPGEFKKPNHPTFSDESIWHGSAGNEGGTWEELPGGETGVHAYRFKPGATNLEHHEPDALKGYFDKVEPGNELVLPQPPAQPPVSPTMGATTPAHFANVRFNNPGAQYPGESSRRFGSTGTATIGGGHLIADFPSPVHGAASNMFLLSQNYKGMTIDSALRKWSGGSRGAPAGYDPNQRIDDKLVNDPKFMTGFMQAVSRGEAPGHYPMDEGQWNQAFNWYQHGGVPGGEAARVRSGAPVQMAEYKGKATREEVDQWQTLGGRTPQQIEENLKRGPTLVPKSSPGVDRFLKDNPDVEYQDYEDHWLIQPPKTAPLVGQAKGKTKIATTQATRSSV